MENNQVDLKQKSIVELKAIAYDLGIMVNEYRNSLNMVNQEIIERSRQENEARENRKPTSNGLTAIKASETATGN
jgi:Sec-independent protein translocase protein TatA